MISSISSKKRTIRQVRKNKTKRNYKRVNGKHTRKHQVGGSDDVEIYYKKPGIMSFGKIEPKTDIQSIKSKQLYELPIIKVNNVGIYRFELSIKNYVGSNNKSYNSYGRGYSSSSGFEKFAEYKHKHNRFMANEKTIVNNINTTVLDKFVKKYKQVSIRITVYKLEKTTSGETYKHYKTYDFNLEPKD